MKIKNSEVAGILFEIADMLEITGANRFKPAAYRRAARSVNVLPLQVSQIYKKHGIKGLKEISGVGSHIALKIEEIIKTGSTEYYKDLKKRVSVDVGELMSIQGIGPKKIKKLYEKLGIKTIEDLKRATLAGKIRKLEGFGKESEKDILEAIGLAKKSKGRIPLKEAQKIASSIINFLKKIKEVKKVEVMGSLRRRRKTVGDIDILASSRKPNKVTSAFVKMKSISKVLAKGPTKVSVVLKSGINCDLRVVMPESWGAASLYFIGSKTYNISLRKIAIKKGYKLSEYGLFSKKTGKMIAGKTEKDVLRKINARYLAPENREV